MTNIIVAFPKPENAKSIKKILMQNGFRVESVCTTGAQVLQCANELGGGIVVCGHRFVDMMCIFRSLLRLLFHCCCYRCCCYYCYCYCL